MTYPCPIKVPMVGYLTIERGTETYLLEGY
jgi:hypothetical protein